MLTKYGAVMAEGTALALHLGHRISIDLDFFTNIYFNLESLILEIRKIGYPYRIISEGEGFLIVDLDSIKVSIFKYDYSFLEKQVVYKGVHVAGILDIASMRL